MPFYVKPFIQNPNLTISIEKKHLTLYGCSKIVVKIWTKKLKLMVRVFFNSTEKR